MATPRTNTSWISIVATLWASAAMAAPDPLPLPTRLAPGATTSAPGTRAQLRLAVLPVLLDPEERLGVSKVFEAVERAAAFRPVRPMSIDDYFFQDGKELSNRALECGEDTKCLSESLAVFRADLGLVVIANLEVSPPLLSLILIDTASAEVVSEAYESLEPTRSLVDQVQANAAAVLQSARLEQAGFLEVLAEPAGARVEVGEGLPHDLGQAHRFTLPPGRYPLRVRASDHEEQERQIEVRPGETTRVEVRLEAESSAWSSPWLWGGLATVVVAGAVTAAVVASQSPADCICIIGAGDDPDQLCQRCR